MHLPSRLSNFHSFNKTLSPFIFLPLFNAIFFQYSVYIFCMIVQTRSIYEIKIRRGVSKICALLWCHAALNASFLLTFRDILSVSSSKGKESKKILLVLLDGGKNLPVLRCVISPKSTDLISPYIETIEEISLGVVQSNMFHMWPHSGAEYKEVCVTRAEKLLARCVTDST